MKTGTHTTDIHTKFALFMHDRNSSECCFKSELHGFANVHCNRRISRPHPYLRQVSASTVRHMNGVNAQRIPLSACCDEVLRAGGRTHNDVAFAMLSWRLGKLCSCLQSRASKTVWLPTKQGFKNCVAAYKAGLQKLCSGLQNRAS